MPTSNMTDEQLFAAYAAAALPECQLSMSRFIDLAKERRGLAWDQPLWEDPTMEPRAVAIAAARVADAMVAEHRKRYPRAQRHSATEAEGRPALEGI
jgi:hypothetical protein